MTGRRVAELTHPRVSQPRVARILRELAAAGLVERTPAGSSSLFVLNRDHLAAGAVGIFATCVRDRGQRRTLLTGIRRDGRALVGSLQMVPVPVEVARRGRPGGVASAPKQGPGVPRRAAEPASRTGVVDRPHVAFAQGVWVDDHGALGGIEVLGTRSVARATSVSLVIVCSLGRGPQAAQPSNANVATPVTTS